MTVPEYDQSLIPADLGNLSPSEEPRLAVFDADGVLWQGDVFEDFTRWLIRRNELDGSQWRRYEAAAIEDPIQACFDILMFYFGMSLEAFQMHVERFWQDVSRPWNQEIISTMHHLKKQGYSIFVVSGTASAVLAPLKRLLPVDQILGIDLEIDPDGRLTGKHTGTPTVAEGKARRIQEVWKKPVHVALGNSILDVEMLKLATQFAWAYEPDGTLLEAAERHGWFIKA